MYKNHQKRESINIIIYLSLIYIFLLLNYYFVISNKFGYAGFESSYFTLSKIFGAGFVTFYMIALTFFMKKNLYKIVYSISLVLLYYGQSIFYIFNNTNFQLVIYMTIPLLMIFILDKVDNNKYFKRKTINIKDKYTRWLLVFVIILLMLPFFKYIKTVDLSNLLFLNIYETRYLLREYDRGILGYIFSPLTRIFLPILFIYGITTKNKTLILISFSSVILMFLLNGAVKSVFFGIACAAFFVKGSYIQKEIRFLKYMLLVNVIAFVSYITMGSILINDYMRRIIFVPASLFDTYYNYYLGNFTYFNHSKLYSLLGISDREMPIGLFIGQFVLGKEGLNANTGIFVEGFLSFGTIGVIIFSAFFALLIFIIKKMDLDERYFGILFVYLYIVNTSFIETLLITHGLLFLMLSSAFLIPNSRSKDNPLRHK